MKSIENDILELKAIAEDSSISAPEGLKDEIASSLDTLSFLDEKPLRKPLTYALSVAASLVLILGIGLNLGTHRYDRMPEDTFSDPYLAYAELEKTFEMISSKMDKGLSIAQEAENVLAKTSEIMEKMN